MRTTHNYPRPNPAVHTNESHGNAKLKWVNNRKPLPFQMATGSGKTFTAITEVYRLKHAEVL